MSTPADAPSTEQSPARLTAARGRLGAVRARVRALPGGHIAWRVGITVIGVVVVVIGIVLLPLPGPGWLIIFSGLGLLATEYPWASRLLTRARRLVTGWTRWIAARSMALQVLLGVVGLLFLVAVVLGCWYLVRLF